MHSDDLLRTGEAAAVLGCSRQHVTDLCRAGQLPFRTIGTHRRIARRDLERFVAGITPAQDAPREIVRQRLRSLWLHRAVAGRIAIDPDGVRAIARANLDRALAIHPRSRPWVDVWSGLVDDPERVMHHLTATDAESDELRQNTPFAGVLDEVTRTRIMEAFARWWRGTHEA